MTTIRFDFAAYAELLQVFLHGRLVTLSQENGGGEVGENF
ncbi:MAG: hypothetical protein ETSY1_26020 [Candidatus Entotheonella factor]|uniref:Uncharacterized protein n=1 Tax=Entotheonella factor TaxID=1429438 RepID=W4LES1_ENTF1|nr:MAG: hypothetical protein ETSY1_26020 [Candidatus Entotheonella factor]